MRQWKNFDNQPNGDTVMKLWNLMAYAINYHGANSYLQREKRLQDKCWRQQASQWREHTGLCGKQQGDSVIHSTLTSRVSVRTSCDTTAAHSLLTQCYRAGMNRPTDNNQVKKLKLKQSTVKIYDSPDDEVWIRLSEERSFEMLTK